ncbi:abortive infection system antitoxin AbiGi family protein [Chryseobacterium sp. SIMBA_028]|uniref:abortive infection system antitoxin AbiGi family protein n=1 Tax=Chryseobacterium sp. SIMBA_028 TaxID=3085771 RepID=UPI00397C929E
MQKSSNSLLHFTKNLEVIIKILEDKFYGSYCIESFQYQNLSYYLPVPKISFCDIPEETIRQYTHYGKYCIGLSKEWGKRNQLNPVLYIERNSSIAKSFITAYKGTDAGVHLVNKSVEELTILFNRMKSDDSLGLEEKDNMNRSIEEMLDRIEALGKIVTFGQYMPFYVKPYEADLIRKDETTLNYRFYDEREWCFVPSELQTSNEHYMTCEQFNIWREKDENRKKPLLKKVALSFDFNDITHLIVENEVDLVNLKSAIDKISSPLITEKSKNHLKSIITIFGR